METCTISHYNILERIGEGGMGVVYKARDLHLDRLVALKLLPSSLNSDPHLVKKFILEARTASQLDHPNICTIHEIAYTDDNHLFIVMSLCQGQTLEQLLTAYGRLPLEQFLNISIQITQGLVNAHRDGIIHRDIKPANIFISQDGLIKILDFGLAALKEDISNPMGTSAAGTVAYMSPEQAMGLPLDQRADIWSLGVMMYQMLGGRLPFDQDNDQKLIYAILKKEPESLSKWCRDLPSDLEELVHKTLQKDPEQRIGTMQEVEHKLTEIRRREFEYSLMKAILKKLQKNYFKFFFDVEQR